MSRITHCSYFPLNIDYWDYYILCGLNIEAARILQRLEFWDGTKGEDSHDGASLQASRFIWKSEEELSWELMGSCGEKRLAACLHFLVNDRQYVVSRANPVRRFDRTKQYAVQVQRIQEHLNKLDGLIKTLLEAGRQLRPVQYAIELLTRKGIPIEALTVEQIAGQLTELHQTMQEDDERRANATHRSAKARLPTFIRLHLQKDEANSFCASSPLGKTSVSIPQHDGIESPEVRYRHAQHASLEAGSLTGAIPENTSRRIQTVHTDRAGATTGDQLHETVSATASSCPLTRVPVSEPLVSAPSPQRQVEQTGKSPTAAVIETGGGAYFSPLSFVSEPGTAQEVDEAPNTDLCGETIVGLFEQKRGQIYDAKTRTHQLASARTLLALQLPLTAELVTRMYDECYDDWWREHYGALHVSHLVECERSHGQPRIVRLLQRVQTKARRKMHPPAQAKASSAPMSSLPPEMVGHIPDVLQDCTIVGSVTPYGWTGWAYSGNVAEPIRLVQWNGAIVPFDDALKDGYNGGWERFCTGGSDDLDALVRKYQEQGILPHHDYLNEGGSHDEQVIAR